MIKRFVPLSEVAGLAEWSRDRQHLAKDHRYDEIVAATLSFASHAVVLEGEDGRVLAIQPCFFVEQDLIITAPPIVRTIAAAVRRFFPSFLRLKMLMAGCAAGEGHPGEAATHEPSFIAEIHSRLLAAARTHGARLVVWKDIPARYRSAFSGLRSDTSSPRCAALASMPATRLALDFTSFDDYLARRLSHAMRKNLRRKFKALQTTPPLVMEVTNTLGDDTDAALALYEQVRDRSPLQFERLTKTFLQQLTDRLDDRVRFFLWRQEGRLVAFSLCFVHEGVLYDEYLGLDYTVALDLHLYFVTFRDVLSWALAQGLTAYHSTPLNYTPKLHLGFELAPLDLYVALTSPWLNRLARPFLALLSPTGAEPSLAKFSNAHAMRIDA